MYKILIINILIFFQNFLWAKKKVDLIVYNARVYTLDAQSTIAESFAVRKGKIIAIGKNEEILNI